MKLCYTFVLFSILGLSSWVKADDWKAISNICQAKVQTTDEALRKFYKNGMNPADAKEAIKCHIKCVMQKRGSFKNGQFDEKTFVENIQKILGVKDQKAAFTKLAAECKNKKGANDCDTAYKIQMCFTDKKDAFGLTKYNIMKNYY